MAKKMDLRGKNASRDAAGIKTIEHSPAFMKIVEHTQNILHSVVDNTNEATPEINSVVEKIVGNVKEEYKKIPTSQLVPAPLDWNYFTPLSEEKKAMMAESIYHNGLLQPIIVRSLNEENTSYEILAGHHRTEAYAVLYAITNDEKYLQIESRVFPFGQLTDEQAKEIVEDTNFVQRGNLSAKDKAVCIYNKAKALKARGIKGDVMSKVAEHFGLNRSTAFTWKKLITLIPDFGDYFAQGNITLTTAGKIASFPEDVQEELYKNLELITNESIAQIKKHEDPKTIIDKLKDFAVNGYRKRENRKMTTEINDDQSFSIHVDKAPGATIKPVLLYLPEKQLKSLQKRYGAYIVEP